MRLFSCCLLLVMFVVIVVNCCLLLVVFVVVVGVEGFSVRATSLLLPSFNVTASCASGYDGKAGVTPCTEEFLMLKRNSANAINNK